MWLCFVWLCPILNENSTIACLSDCWISSIMLICIFMPICNIFKYKIYAGWAQHRHWAHIWWILTHANQFRINNVIDIARNSNKIAFVECYEHVSDDFPFLALGLFYEFFMSHRPTTTKKNTLQKLHFSNSIKIEMMTAVWLCVRAYVIVWKELMTISQVGK